MELYMQVPSGIRQEDMMETEQNAQQQREESAKRLLESYTPVDQEKLDRMIKVISNATSRKELEQLTMLYLLDMSYDRTDLMYAVSYTERLNGLR